MEGLNKENIEGNSYENIIKDIQDSLPGFKNKIQEILNEYSSELIYLNLIKGSKGGLEFYYEFSTATGITICIRMRFSKDKYLNKPGIVELRTVGNEKYFSYSNNCTHENFFDVIESNIVRGAYGHKFEMELYDKIRSFIDTDNSFFKSVKLARAEDNIKGIDLIISCIDEFGKNHEVPLQIKTNSNDQKKHESRYPLIPSIVISRSNIDSLDTKNKVLKISEKYIKGEIINI
jgi:hypothetical protein